MLVNRKKTVERKTRQINVAVEPSLEAKVIELARQRVWDKATLGYVAIKQFVDRELSRSGDGQAA